MQPLYTRTFAILFAGQVLFVLAHAALTHYARWVEWLDGSVRDVGLILGAAPIVGLALRPWMGQWIDRIGTKTALATGLVLFAVTSAGNIAVDTLGVAAYLLRIGNTFGTALVFTSSLAYVAHIAPPARRTEAIGVMGAAGFVGMSLGPFLGDLFLGEEGNRTWSQFALFFAAVAGLCVLPFASLALLPRPPSEERVGAVRLRDFVETTRRFWPGSILLVVLVFGIALTVPFGFIANFIDAAPPPPESGSEIGYFFLGYGGWGFTVRLASRRVPDRVGRRKVLLLGTVTLAAGMFSFLWVEPTHVAWLLLPGVLCGTGHALMFHTMMALVLQPFPAAANGTASALALMVLDAGTMLGGPILGELAEGFGFAALFVTVGCSLLFASVWYTIASVPVWVARARMRRADSKPGARAQPPSERPS